MIGLLVWAFARATRQVRSVDRKQGRRVIETGYIAVSLGQVVFWTRTSSRYFEHSELTQAHEWGHTVQSRALGPAYLLVVGAPSVARVAFAVLYRELSGRRWSGYFDGWPELQADAHGGIVRDEQGRRVLAGSERE